MNLNDLLNKQGIDAKRTLVFRHRPTEPELKKILPWLAAERPETFNAYQQTQGEKVERMMTGAAYVASFIGHEPGKAVFVGLYAIGNSKPLTRPDYWKVPAYIEMKRYGMEGFTEASKRNACLWFDLVATDFYAQWKGRLVLDWPGPERVWARRAHQNEFSVDTILEVSTFNPPMPKWDTITLSWNQLAVLPKRWMDALAEWRAIYYICDTSDGKGYVGSAYGQGNLLDRWLNYSASGHGGNTMLRERNRINFRFSILQRVSPDMDPDEVIRLEGTWKQRLHTISHGLNEN